MTPEELIEELTKYVESEVYVTGIYIRSRGIADINFSSKPPLTKEEQDENAKAYRASQISSRYIF